MQSLHFFQLVAYERHCNSCTGESVDGTTKLQRFLFQTWREWYVWRITSIMYGQISSSRTPILIELWIRHMLDYPHQCQRELIHGIHIPDSPISCSLTNTIFQAKWVPPPKLYTWYVSNIVHSSSFLWAFHKLYTIKWLVQGFFLSL